MASAVRSLATRSIRAALIVVGIGFFFGPPAAAQQAPIRRVGIAIGRAPARGPADAPVTIIEFADYQCPFCGRAEPVLRQIEQAYPGKIRVVWKDLPLSNLHPNAMPAAQAAAAAWKQHKFWPMHDLLLSNQTQLNQANYERWAQGLGLDLARFRQDFASGEIADKIRADVDEAHRHGLGGTPRFFINGRKLEGHVSFDSFKPLIDEELAASR